MSEAAPPVVRVLSGAPTPQEVAAVLVAVADASRASAAAARDRPAPVTAKRETTGWGAPRHGLRTSLAPGAGAWQRAAGGLA